MLKFKVDDVVIGVSGGLFCGTIWKIIALNAKQDQTLPYLYTVFNINQNYSHFLYEDEIELYKGAVPMALKFKIGDLVKTTATVGLDFQAFPIGSEATIKELIPRAGIGYPYIIHLTQYNRDVAVMEKEIEFVNPPTQTHQRPPIYKKLIGQSSAAHWYIVEDNHGTHYTVIDTSDAHVRIGSKHNKDLFANFKEDANFIPNKVTNNNIFGGQSIKDIDTLPTGQGNQQTITTGCQHQWQAYTGLSESFEFCKICDTKRNKKVSA